MRQGYSVVHTSVVALAEDQHTLWYAHHLLFGHRIRRLSHLAAPSARWQCTSSGSTYTSSCYITDTMIQSKLWPQVIVSGGAIGKMAMHSIERYGLLALTSLYHMLLTLLHFLTL